MILRVLQLVFWQMIAACVALILRTNVCGDHCKTNWTALNVVLIGAWFGSVIWAIGFFWHANRTLLWLRNNEEDAGTTNIPTSGGIWGEVCERTRRLLRKKQQETMLAEQRLTGFLSAIQASPNGVLLLDEHGQIEWCNLTSAEHFGLDATRDIGQYIVNLVRDPVFTAYMVQGGDIEKAIVIEGKNSSLMRPCRLSVQAHAYQINKKLMLSQDVTALELSEIMRRDFVANVSHEIRTPLTVLNCAIETLQTLPLNAFERQSHLETMCTHTQRMQNLVVDLLTLSTLEGSHTPSLKNWHNVAHLLDECKQEALVLSLYLDSEPMEKTPASMHMQTHPHTITTHVPLQLEWAGNRTELRSAIANLLNNAVRYSATGSTIVVDVCAYEPGGVQIQFQDQGPGIAPEHIARLTERFYRMENSRSKQSGGTGLGLAIVKHVVQRHGGDLHIQSTLGLGSTFSVSIPFVRIRGFDVCDLK